MSKTMCLILACLGVSGIFAQWSVDPQFPNPIAAFNAEQVLPKVAIADNGNTYICRFDNSGGSYKVWLQLFSPQGEALWTAPAGMLLSDHAQMSWLTEYDMTTDDAGNAIITFQDIRSAGVNNVMAYKISPEGSYLWGADGVAVSVDTSTDYANMAPVIFQSEDNTTYLAWQRMGTSTSVKINRLSATGEKLWGANGISINSITGSNSWPQIIQAGDDGILVKYYLDTGNFPALTRHIYIAKYNLDGQRIWNTQISNAGGISAWQQLISFQPDGAGGAVLAWYDDRDNNMIQDVYTQRVNSAGAVTMPANGVLITVDGANQQYDPKLAVDEATQRIYAFFRVTDADQNNSGLGRQLLDFTGNRLWGDTAPLVINIGPDNCETIGAYYTSLGAVCLYQYGPENLYAVCRNISDSNPWPVANTLIAGTTDTKYHYSFDVHPDKWIVLAWEQGFSNMDIYAMRLNPGGSLGMDYPPPYGLTATAVPPHGVLLNWQAPSQYMTPVNYYIFLDGGLGQEVAGNVTSHQFSDLTYGDHFFFVMAGYGGDHLSIPSEIASITLVDNDDPSTPPFVPVLSVYPNPCKGSGNLSFNLDKPSQKCRISIYNLRGQKLSEKDIAASVGMNSLSLAAADFAPTQSGVYLIRLELDKELRTVKAVFMK